MTEKTVYRSSRQGGIRYENVVSDKASSFKWNFEDNLYMLAQPVWDALTEGHFRRTEVYEIFSGTEGPLNVEIGIGNGEFLAHYASENRASRWIGFEVFHEVFEKAVKRIKRLELDNVRLIQFDAEFFVRLLPPSSVSGFYVNFPDPWPKTRHHKRRLLKPWFIELMGERLISGGTLTIATDHADYSREIRENLSQVSGFRSLVDPLPTDDMGDYFKTKYYRKFASKDRVYFYKLEKE